MKSCTRVESYITEVDVHLCKVNVLINVSILINIVVYEDMLFSNKPCVSHAGRSLGFYAHAPVPAAPRTAPVLLQRQTGRHTIGCRAKTQNHVTM